MAQAGGGGGGGWGDPAIHHVAPAPAGMGGWGWAAVLEARTTNPDVADSLHALRVKLKG